MQKIEFETPEDTAKKHAVVGGWLANHGLWNRQKNFTLRGIKVLGAGVGGGGKKVLGSFVKVAYAPKDSPDAADSGYHMLAMPPSIGVLILFHVVKEELLDNPPAPHADSVYVVGVKQARFAEDNPTAFEPICGQVEVGETLLQAALRETKEELGNEAFANLPAITENDLVAYNKINPHPAIAEEQTHFRLMFKISEAKFNAMRESLTGHKGGIAEEDEFTTVGVRSLRDAYHGATSSVVRDMFAQGILSIGIPVPVPQTPVKFSYVMAAPERDSRPA